MKVKTDCFGFNSKTGRCKALLTTVCEVKDCPFYKTMEQFQKEMGEKK